jgi:hypothetical protein
MHELKPLVSARSTYTFTGTTLFYLAPSEGFGYHCGV